MFLELLLTNPAYFITVILIVILSICLHEFAHALAATWQGDTTARDAGYLTFNPWRQMGPGALVMLLLVGISWGATPVNPTRFRQGRLGESFVSLAGPLMNLLLMILALTVIYLVRIDWLPVPDSVTNGLLMVSALTAMLNAALFLLNLIPVPPLDGFGVVEPLIPWLRRYRERIAPYGFFVLMLLFFVLGLGRRLFDLAALLMGWVYQSVFGTPL